MDHNIIYKALTYFDTYNCVSATIDILLLNTIEV